MIPAGYVSALVIWANAFDGQGAPDATLRAQRIEYLIAERDALVTAFLGGQTGKPQRTLTSAGAGGKSFTWDLSMTREQKLTVVTDALISLGAIPPSAAPVIMTHATFGCLQR